MRVERATEADFQELVCLWKTVFGDDEEEIRLFLRRFLNKHTALVVRERERIVSMLFLIRTALCLNGATVPIGYIYAGATYEEYRGKGMYKHLLESAEQEATRCGMTALFLQPADALLAETYQRCGFTIPLFAHRARNTVCAKDSSFRLLTPQEFAERRKQQLQLYQVPFIEWPLEVYEHCDLWSQAIDGADGGMRLCTKDDAVVLEMIENSPSLCSQAVGLMKPLSNDTAFFREKIYMGYAMD